MTTSNELRRLNNQPYKGKIEGNTYYFKILTEPLNDMVKATLEVWRNGELIYTVNGGTSNTEESAINNIMQFRADKIRNLKASPIKLSEYEEQAIKFLENTETDVNAEYLGHQKHFADDKEYRAVFEITITRKNRTPMTFKFGNSIINSYQIKRNKDYINPMFAKTVDKGAMFQFLKYFKLNKPVLKDTTVNTQHGELTIKKDISPPTPYDILSCIQKYDVGSLEDFCSEMGGDPDSIKFNNIYLAVQKEWADVRRLGFNDHEMELLREIA